MADTEGKIRDWRSGTTQAERMCAALLHLEGYEDIDPQHPLGGPDGLKDVLCKKNGKKWVAAAFFPPTLPTLKQIKDKFAHDLDGVTGNDADAMAFFVNQHLTIGEREELRSRSPNHEVELYHLERIRDLLDSPKGCGIRLEYLHIPMTEEEQWAFWSVMNADVVRKLVDNEMRRNQQMTSMESKIDLLLERSMAIEANLRSQRSLLSKASTIATAVEMPTASFTAATVCWIHRLLTEDTVMPEAVRGRFRTTQSWIGKAGSTLATASYVPPPPEEVPLLLEHLLIWWHQRHEELIGRPKSEVATSLADLHHRFLALHPFLDCNGRVARAITDQAARELLNQGVQAELIDDSASYYEALRSADQGDLVPLTQRILAALG
ncbi:Fic family protein [Granulicella pectinivorans]|uniref:Fic family protein n=1 Tax=Granulicella pectinivorans TaxID=474950 RepID=A0A1I6MQC1_9BACT|nr:Fic family protein [Granulicella pectinivorans]SFS17913.1 Fic family protein [Granulicella pectinivorans]